MTGKTKVRPEDAYARLFPAYQAYAGKMRTLLEDLLKTRDITYQVVESRAKTQSSFNEKIGRSGKSYADPLNELPDLCGCRVIVYYLDDVIRVADLLKSEFTVVEEELSHQSSSLQADRFGYLSAHYIVKLNEARSKLPEWTEYESFRSEIQVRTVIQHAWSAVSHALQYKAEVSIPSKLQRRLYRIAGLFELADEEFGGIRDQRAELRERASVAIASGHTDIPITNATLAEFISSWPKLSAALDAAKEGGFDIEDYDDGDETYSNLYDLTTKLDISTISELRSTLDKQSLGLIGSIYRGQRHKRGWAASKEFIVYLLLLLSSRDLITSDYLIGRGWSKDIAEDVVKSLQRKG